MGVTFDPLSLATAAQGDEYGLRTRIYKVPSALRTVADFTDVPWLTSMENGNANPGLGNV